MTTIPCANQQPKPDLQDMPQPILAIGFYAYEITPVGSMVTCNPPPDNIASNIDYLAYVGSLKEFETTALALGWKLGGSLPTDEYAIPPHHRFRSVTLERYNVIATESEEFNRRFLAATSVAKRLNLLHKDDRIALFQAVLYGRSVS